MSNLELVAISEEELHQTLDKVKENSQYWLLFKTLAETGLRASEVNKLTPNCLNIYDLTITIKGKGKIGRTIKVSRNLIQFLTLYKTNEKMKNSDFFFPFTRNWIWELCKKYSGYRTHAFRHHYAIKLMRLTRNVRYVQRQLGHKHLSTTEKYLRAIEFEIEDKQIEDLD